MDALERFNLRCFVIWNTYATSKAIERMSDKELLDTVQHIQKHKEQQIKDPPVEIKSYRRRVLVESPYGSDDPAVILDNVKYARQCMRDCLLRGENPYASHLLFTQEGILDDSILEERTLGIAAGLDWGQFAEATVVYTDRGLSRGMQFGIENAKKMGRSIEYRSLNKSSSHEETDTKNCS